MRIHVDTDHDPDTWEQIDAVKLLTSSAPPANAAPEADGDSVTTSEDVPVQIDVLANDSDSDSDPLALVSWTTPEHGWVWLDTHGTPNDPSDDFFLYTPDADYSGSDSFSYTMSWRRRARSRAW